MSCQMHFPYVNELSLYDSDMNVKVNALNKPNCFGNKGASACRVIIWCITFASTILGITVCES